MFVLSILLIYLTSNSLTRGENLSDENPWKKAFEIYDPISGNSSMLVDMNEEGSDKGSAITFKGTACVCTESHCKCCLGLRVELINFDKIGCIELFVNLQILEFEVKFSIDTDTIMDFKVDVLPSTPVVLPVKADFHSCFSLFATFEDITLFKLNIGCVQWGKDGLKFMDDVRLDDILVKSVNQTEKEN